MTAISTHTVINHMFAVSRNISRSNHVDEGAFLSRIYAESRSFKRTECTAPQRMQALRHISFRQAALRQLAEDSKSRHLPAQFVDDLQQIAFAFYE